MTREGTDVVDTRRTTVLGVALLEVAQALHELLDGDVLVVGDQVALGSLPRVVDERVCVCREARDACDDVSARE